MIDHVGGFYLLQENLHIVLQKRKIMLRIFSFVMSVVVSKDANHIRCGYKFRLMEIVPNCREKGFLFVCITLIIK